MPNRKAKLLKLQLGKCPWCGLSFQYWDVMETDHKIPRAIGGKDEYKNLQLLHRHCHEEKTALDLKEMKRKDHSKFQEKLSQFWEKFDWKWVNDIPNFISRAVRKSDLTNGQQTQPCAVKVCRKHGSEWEGCCSNAHLDPTELT